MRSPSLSDNSAEIPAGEEVYRIALQRARGGRAAASRSLYVAPAIVAGVYAALETAALVLSVAKLAETSGHVPGALAVSCTIVGLLVAVSSSIGAYRAETLSKLGASLGRGTAAVVIGFGAALVLAATIADVAAVPAPWLYTTFGWCLAVIGGGRLAAFLALEVLARSGFSEHRLAVIGGGELGQRLIRRLATSTRSDVTLVGFFDDRASRVPREIDGAPYLGRLDEITSWVREHGVQTIIVALPWAADRRINQIRKRLWLLPVDVRLSPDRAGFSLAGTGFDQLAGLPLLGVGARPIAHWAALAKRVEDLVIATLLLLALAPFLALIAVLVKLDSPGPAFFRQRRTGYGGNLIEVIKFRTIKTEHTDANAERLVSKNDDRVTRLGRFLRRSSLDELPQLFNVLRGDMSIIGPRPHPLSAKAAGWLYPEVVANYAARHKVRPGITGWAQVNGWRGETDSVEKIQQRVAHDLYYIEHWSLWLDLKILIMTVLACVSSEQAY